MQKTITSLFVLGLLVIGVASVRTSAMLVWDYPTAELPSVSFNVYHAINAAGPFSVLTNVSATNCTVQILQGSHFYYVTATNEWGESDPSETASATVARRGQNLRITIP